MRILSLSSVLPRLFTLCTFLNEKVLLKELWVLKELLLLQELLLSPTRDCDISVFLSPFGRLRVQCREFGGYFLGTAEPIDKIHEAEESGVTIILSPCWRTLSPISSSGNHMHGEKF